MNPTKRKLEPESSIPVLPIYVPQLISVKLEDPEEVGYYSVDSSRSIKYDRSQMKYYVPRSNSSLPLNLNIGFENTSYRTKAFTAGEPEKMDHILGWIKHNEFKCLDRTSRSLDFVTHRGTLRKIMSTPTSPEEWTICATKFMGTIYFAVVSTDAQESKNANISETDQKMTSWGYKFEEYMTANTPWGEPDTSSTTHEIEEFCIVVQSKLRDHSLLYKVEIDGMHSERAENHVMGDTSCYVELKICKETANKELKYLTWWGHATLAGVKETVCGFRDDNGVVKSLEVLKTSRLPFLSKKIRSDILLNFLNSFLDYLKKHVVKDDYRIVYKLEYKKPPEHGNRQRYVKRPRYGNRSRYGNSSRYENRALKKVTCEELENPDSRYQVIPEWYAKEAEKKPFLKTPV